MKTPAMDPRRPRPLPPTYASPWVALYAIWANRRLRRRRIRARTRDKHS